MKKIILTVILCTAMIFACLSFGACSDSDIYTGNQFVLEEISAVYDDAVTEDEKNQCELMIANIRQTIGKENAPYCRFYTIYNTLLTNCNGINRLSIYKVEKGKVTIDTSTSETKDKFKLPFQPMKFYINSSLENAVFGNENGKLVMTESIEGVTVKYVFGENGKVNESADIYKDTSYDFVDITYWHYTTDEAKDRETQSVAQAYAKDYITEFIKIQNTSTLKIGDFLYDLQFSEKNEHSAQLISPKSGESTATVLFYGDLLISCKSGTGIPYCLYFLKSE